MTVDVVYAGVDARDLLNLVGEIPFWLDEDDPRSAREQLDSHYQHGGGWCPFEGFELNRRNFALQYPGDPPQHPFAFMTLRDEKIVMYPHAWVMILQPNGDYEICRMD